MTPKFRQALYSIGTVAFAILTVLSTVHLIDPNVAASVSAAITAVLGLFGVSISGVAAYQVTKQARNGSFDAVSPEDQVVNGLNGVVAAKAAADAAVDKVKDALGSAVAAVPVLGPVLGPLAQQALNNLPR